MSWETVPLCDGCWEHTNPDREALRLRAPDLEYCFLCGVATRSGIYTRANVVRNN